MFNKLKILQPVDRVFILSDKYVTIINSLKPSNNDFSVYIAQYLIT